AAERAAEISPDCIVRTFKTFYLPETEDRFDFREYDYVVDAIDTVSAKLALIEEATESGVPIICSMGTGNKLDPTRITVSDISKTNTCPLAAVIRRECRKRGIKKLKVVWSDETPVKVTSEESHGRHAPGSVSFVPPVAGYVAAGEVIRHIAGKE
ncbi:MAG: ThiF family adenylyltransferase, partial [Clostridia bacterium]|nr:ThiF family adenylyltransferase [Clostridia bacterium]